MFESDRPSATEGQLPPPVVAPDAYDEAYFRHTCMGSEEWTSSEGRTTSGLYPGFLTKAGLVPGEVVVDLGTGRAELPVVAVEMGASKAYGVEYSPDAVPPRRHHRRAARRG